MSGVRQVAACAHLHDARPAANSGARGRRPWRHKQDFFEQALHHLVTIALIAFSWVFMYVRVGLLILVSHDAGDVFLELAKLFGYFRKQRICDALFVLFAIGAHGLCVGPPSRASRSRMRPPLLCACHGTVFGVSRLWFYPQLIYSSIYEVAVVSRPYQPTACWWLFCILLCTLQVPACLCKRAVVDDVLAPHARSGAQRQVLNAFWFGTILRMAVSFIRRGFKVERDVRSETEESGYDEQIMHRLNAA